MVQRCKRILVHSKKEDKRVQVNFLDGCVFWLHWHQLLINGNIYFHSWKSYFCSFSFHSVFLIPLFIYLKGRPSCSFSTIARSGLLSQLTIPGKLWARLGMWKVRTRCTGDIALSIVLVMGTPTCCCASHSIAPNFPCKYFNYERVWWAFPTH